MESTAHDIEIQNAIEALEKLESCCNRLSQQLALPRLMKPLSIYELPLRNSGKVPDIIPVIKHSGDSARRLAIEALTALHMRSDQSALETLRVPGIIWVSKEIEADIREMIALKQRFEATMLALRSPAEEISRYHPKKRRFLKLPCAQGLSLKQAYRIPETSNTLKTISFYWDTSFSIAKVQVKELRQRLFVALNHITSKPVEHISQVSQVSGDNRPAKQLADDIEMLKQYPDEEVLAECWPKTPHPRAYILDEQGPHFSHTSTPLLYFGTATNEISILDGRFQDWVSQSTEHIHRQLQPEPVIERLGIYRYKKDYRLYELPEKKKANQRKKASVTSG